MLGCSCDEASPGQPATPPSSLSREAMLAAVFRALRAAYPDRASQIFAAFQREIPGVLDVTTESLIRISGRFCSVDSAGWEGDRATVTGHDFVATIESADPGPDDEDGAT